MKTLALAFLGAAVSAAIAPAQTTPPLRVAIIGLVHGHASGFLSGGALAPAGGLMHRQDTDLIGVVEADDQLFDAYAKRFHWNPSLHFHSIAEMVSHVHPDAALVFTSTRAHKQVVEECAARGIHVMMEKPMAASYADALAMQAAAEGGHIHLLVDYETTWYSSNKAAFDVASQGAIGPIVKAVFRDGHNGPRKIHVSPEFLNWLTDPNENGAGALYDFGCYGADLMTWLMRGEVPLSVSAITKHLQPELYPKVDDEADIVLNYQHAIAIVQGSWNWPFGVKQGDIYGTTGFAKSIDSASLEVRREGQVSSTFDKPAALSPPYDDPLHYFAAVIRGEIKESDEPSSLKTNVVVSEILDAARQSAASGATVSLPLKQ